MAACCAPAALTFGYEDLAMAATNVIPAITPSITAAVSNNTATTATTTNSTGVSRSTLWRRMKAAGLE